MLLCMNVMLWCSDNDGNSHYCFSGPFASQFGNMPHRNMVINLVVLANSWGLSILFKVISKSWLMLIMRLSNYFPLSLFDICYYFLFAFNFCFCFRILMLIWKGRRQFGFFAIKSTKKLERWWEPALLRFTSVCFFKFKYSNVH